MLSKAAKRRQSLLQSLDQDKKSGGVTTYLASEVAEAFKGQITECTIDKYFRTYVFEFPKARLKDGNSQEPLTIYEDGEFRATIVTDVEAYFQSFTKSPHYSIYCDLRASVDELPRDSDPHIFVVIEEYRSIKSTTLNNGESFVFPEVIDGQQTVKGGRQGEYAICAVRTIDGSWPTGGTDNHLVNAVLAAIKAEQGLEYAFSELINDYCYVTEDNKPVYPLYLGFNIKHGGVRVTSPIDSDELAAKADRIRMIMAGLQADREKPEVAELIDALKLEDSDDDKYFRLWYLRLWQAVDGAKRVFDIRDFRNENKPFTKHRDAIAHWETGKIDFALLSSLQKYVSEVVHRKYIEKRSQMDLSSA